MTLYQDKYRIESARRPGWDYTASGCYFVTLCTRDRVCCCGEIAAGQMNHSAIGEIMAEEWQRTAQLRPYVEVDE